MNLQYERHNKKLKVTVNTLMEKNLVECMDKEKSHHAWKRDMASDY